MLRQVELVEKVRAYQPDMDEAVLNRAYVYATKMHGKQRRASGDPYYSHPIEVAGILTGLHLDVASIATALLHDTLEDTTATPTEIEAKFGKEILRLVNGVTKLSRLERESDDTVQAENFRKLLVATASDIRVLLVKLADRLHNMRTLHHIKTAAKRRRIAQETLDVYAPLAGRMGMQAFREEMEDLAFAQLHPKAYDLLRRHRDQRGKEDTAQLESILDDVRKLFRRYRQRATISGRTKGLFSIWQKMEHKSISLEQLSDMYGVRVIVPGDADCYKSLGILHRSWACVPGRYKDYISLPKRNGYRSLHTTVIGPNEQRIEFQIRTPAMHDVAENGVAAHWAYKDHAGGKRNGKAHAAIADITETRQFQWLRDIVQSFQQDDSAEEFLKYTKLELFSDQVFCFTPRGRLIALPHGATAIDFAYGVHTEIGHSCAGVRINGRQCSLRQRLQNGDEVEIIRAKGQHPSAHWEAFAVTGKAQAAIRRACRAHLEDEQRRLGEEILQRAFRSEGRDMMPDALERALGPFHVKTISELEVAVGKGEVSAHEVMQKIYPRSRTRRFLRGAMQALANRVTRSKSPVAVPVRARAQSGAISFADSCFALPGDKIVGIRQTDGSIMVYPVGSKSLAAYERKSKDWVMLDWIAPQADMRFASRLHLTLANKVGSVGTVTQTIAEYGINISNLAILRRDSDFYDMQIDVEVSGVQQVHDLIAALKGSRVVRKVKRIIAADADIPAAPD